MALPSITALVTTLFPGPSAIDLLGHRIGVPMTSVVAAHGGETFRVSYATGGDKPRLEGWAKADGNGGLGELTVVIFGAESDSGTLDELVQELATHLEEHRGQGRALSSNENVQTWTFDDREFEEAVFIETFEDGGPCVSINIGGVESDYLPAQTEQLSLAEVQARLHELDRESK
jgi:hypothetical protein